MKAFGFIVIFMSVMFSSQTITAQNETETLPAPNHLCSQPEQRQKLLKEHPEILELEKSMEVSTQEWIKNHKGKLEKSTTGRIIIPFVFHVINEGGIENVSDAQLIDEVRIMNIDYNKQNADTADAVGNFKYIIANMGVEWRLAKLDPNGNCTNGIDRITSDQTYVGDDYSKLNGWPREKYVNVWLIGQFQIPGAAGYAYYASDVAVDYNFPHRDGVIILSNYMGSIGTGSAFTSKALTHEIGHCFNLQHCWGNTNNPEVSCGDDEVEDTPETMGWLSCPTPSGAQICNPGIVENYQNYMEYSYCSVMFTEGQKARWLATANSPVSGRNNLWTDSNLIATGTYDTLPSPCAPIAGFSVKSTVANSTGNNSRYVCTGTPVQLLNSSGNGTITSRHWTLPTGTTFATGSNDSSLSPTVMFSRLGWQVISLTVSNSYGSSTYTDSNLVYVSSTTASITAPYYEGFEDPGIFNTGRWTSVNFDANNKYDNNITWFTQTTSAAHNGNGSAVLNNYDAHANFDIDEIITPGINMTAVPTAKMQLSFYYSWASANQYLDGQDSMVVYASTDCGVTWRVLSNAAKLGSTGGNAVLNAGYVQANFVPTTAPAYWKQVTLSLTPSTYQVANVHFKIRAFTSIHGNNLYIDDFNVGGAPVPTGIEQPTSITGIQLFPNPTTGDATLSVQLENAGKVVVKVYDISGKLVMSPFDGWMNAGENNVAIDGYAHLAHGVYIVNVIAGESVVQKKLIVQ